MIPNFILLEIRYDICVHIYQLIIILMGLQLIANDSEVKNFREC